MQIFNYMDRVSAPLTPVLLTGQLNTLWCHLENESDSQFSRITHSRHWTIGTIYTKQTWYVSAFLLLWGRYLAGKQDSPDAYSMFSVSPALRSSWWVSSREASPCSREWMKSHSHSQDNSVIIHSTNTGSLTCGNHGLGTRGPVHAGACLTTWAYILIDTKTSLHIFPLSPLENEHYLGTL